MTALDLTTSDLATCEEIIARGLGTFVEVGQALLRIRDERLYRESHDTFEAYCRERWGFSRERGRQLINAAEVIESLPPTIVATPPNEAVARELAPLRSDPERLRETWAEAVAQHGATPTAVQVREVVNERASEAPMNKRDAMRANAHKRRIVDTVSYLRGLATGLGDLDVQRAVQAMDPGEAGEWAKELDRAIARLRALRRDLEQHA